MTDEIHDTTRVDAYLRARQRVAFLHAVWRPMLAGAAGAALVIAAVWVTLPKISYREIEVPKVTMRDAVVPNIVMHDVTVEHIVPKDVEIDIPHVASADPPRTPEERRFVDQPAYRDAEFKGRIVESIDGRALSFEGGKSFWPAHIDPATGKAVADPQHAFDSDRLVGSYGLCVKYPSADLWTCTALVNGKEQPVIYRQGRAT